MSVALTMHRGDDRSLTILVEADGVPVDLTGAALRFTAKRRAKDADASAVITKTTPVGSGIEITDALGGGARVDLVAADTVALTRDTTLVWDLQARTAGKTLTLDTGTLLVRQDVSRTSP